MFLRKLALYNTLPIDKVSKYQTFGTFQDIKQFVFNPVSANPIKWSNTLKQFVSELCLTVLWGWRLKG